MSNVLTYDSSFSGVAPSEWTPNELYPIELQYTGTLLHKSLSMKQMINGIMLDSVIWRDPAQ